MNAATKGNHKGISDTMAAQYQQCGRCCYGRSAGLTVQVVFYTRPHVLPMAMRTERILLLIALTFSLTALVISIHTWTMVSAQNDILRNIGRTATGLQSGQPGWTRPPVALDEAP